MISQLINSIWKFSEFSFLLKIVDRKKDLVKLQYGEYVSLGKVESELKTCSLVDNVCVYADPSKMFAVALIMPNPNNLKDIINKGKLIIKYFFLHGERY